MPRRIKAIGLGVVLSTSAMAGHAPSTDSATMQVTLTIVESCVVRSDGIVTHATATQPDVACPHDTPYRMTLFAQPTADQSFGLAKVSSSQATQPAIWQITF